MKTKTIIYFILGIVISLSCAKEEGEGGKITIKGKIKQINLSEDNLVISEEYLVDEDVFIIYGKDGEYANEDINTGIDGSFEFEYLYPGNYTVYVVGDDTTGTEVSGQSVYKVDVELSKSDDVKDIGEISTYNFLDFDDGFATISGKVFQVDYFGGTTVVSDTIYAQNEEVYLIYNDHDAYDERVRTSFDGSFSFTNLIKGDYTIYTYSEDLTPLAEELIPEKRNVSITKNFEEVSIDTIFIKNEL